MKGTIYHIHAQRGMVAVATEDADYSIFEILGSGSFEAGDTVSWVGSTPLGHHSIHNHTKSEMVEVFFQNTLGPREPVATAVVVLNSADNLLASRGRGREVHGQLEGPRWAIRSRTLEGCRRRIVSRPKAASLRHLGGRIHSAGDGRNPEAGCYRFMWNGSGSSAASADGDPAADPVGPSRFRLRSGYRRRGRRHLRR